MLQSCFFCWTQPSIARVNHFSTSDERSTSRADLCSYLTLRQLCEIIFLGHAAAINAKAKCRSQSTRPSWNVRFMCSVNQRDAATKLSQEYATYLRCVLLNLHNYSSVKSNIFFTISIYTGYTEYPIRVE